MKVYLHDLICLHPLLYSHRTRSSQSHRSNLRCRRDGRSVILAIIRIIAPPWCKTWANICAHIGCIPASLTGFFCSDPRPVGQHQVRSRPGNLLRPPFVFVASKYKHGLASAPGNRCSSRRVAPLPTTRIATDRLSWPHAATEPSGRRANV